MSFMKKNAKVFLSKSVDLISKYDQNMKIFRNCCEISRCLACISCLKRLCFFRSNGIEVNRSRHLQYKKHVKEELG